MSAGTISPSTVVADPWSLRPVVGKFKIMFGIHSEGAVPGTYRTDPTGTPLFDPRQYYPGEVVASRSDLLKHNRLFSHEPKFLRVDDATPDKYDAMEKEQVKGEKGVPKPAKIVEDLESMTVAQLKELAKAEEIEIDDTMRKPEMIGWIRQCRDEGE